MYTFENDEVKQCMYIHLLYYLLYVYLLLYEVKHGVLSYMKSKARSFGYGPVVSLTNVSSPPGGDANGLWAVEHVLRHVLRLAGAGG